MVYLIVDKKNENDFEKINYYKLYLQNIYHDDVECIIEDNRVITPLGKEGEALEEKGRTVRKKLWHEFFLQTDRWHLPLYVRFFLQN